MRLVVLCALGSFASAVALLGGFWRPVSKAFGEFNAIETRRLLESFAEPLAKAMASGDDLARVSELRRLQRLPPVRRATLLPDHYEGPVPNIPLAWQGRPVGRLGIQITQESARRWRYACLECAFTLIGLAGLTGGFGGWLAWRRRHRFAQRFSKVLARWRDDRRRCCRLRKLLGRAEEERDVWVRQAVHFVAQGLLLLDGEQRVIAMNEPAQKRLNLPSNAAGRHALDLLESAEWAQALRASLDQPGVPVGFPLPQSNQSATLLTLAGPRGSALSTWIMV